MSCVVSIAQLVHYDRLPLKSPTLFAPNRETLAPQC